MNRILFITPEIPYPPTDGSRIRAYNLSRLLQQEHKVELLIVAPSTEQGDLSRLQSEFTAVHQIPVSRTRMTLNGLLYGIKSRPMQAGIYRSPEIKEWLSTNARRFDLLFSHLVRTTELVANLSLPKIVDLVDSISMDYATLSKQGPIPERWFYRFEQPRLRRYERFITEKFDRALITSERDKQYIDNGALSDEISVIPNGVDKSLLKMESTDTSDRNIVFVGSMDYYPNVDAVRYFANAILPTISEQREETHFTIVGSNPVRSVSKLGQRQNVTVTGFVDDPTEYVSDATVVVAPIRHGAGIQNKVLEAMALGKPVVATPSAASGIETDDNSALVVADSIDKFAEKTIELLDSESYRRKVGKQAKCVVESRYTWDRVAPMLLSTVAEIAGPH